MGMGRGRDGMGWERYNLLFVTLTLMEFFGLSFFFFGFYASLVSSLVFSMT